MEDREDRKKYLEFVQNIVTRMNHCSFQLKRWAVTMVTAIIGISSSPAFNTKSAWIALIPISLFWFLDSSYLHQERKYRGLYKDIINSESTVILYSLDTSKYFCGVCGYLEAMFSRTIVILYLLLYIVTGIYVLIF